MALIIIGRCLIVAYLVAVASSFFPVRFTELGWQQQLLDSLLNAGTVPITGRVFILLAVVYKGYDLAGIADDPSENQSFAAPTRGILAKRKIARLIRNVQRTLSRLGRILRVFGPSLIFIIIAVLQLFVSARSFRALDISLLNQTSLLTQQSTQLRAAITGSSDRAVLQQAIQGLVPEQQRESLLSRSVAEQKKSLTQLLGDKESTIRQDFEKQRSQRFASLVVLTIKNVFLALLFAWCLYWLRPAAVRAFMRGVS
jgi:hypothetical protein